MVGGECMRTVQSRVLVAVGLVALMASTGAGEATAKFTWTTDSGEAKTLLAELQQRIESFQFGPRIGNILPLLFQFYKGLPASHLVDDLLRFELPIRFIQGDTGFFDVEVTLLLLQGRVEIQVLTLEHRLVMADLGRSDHVLEVFDIVDMINSL